jgi:cold shock CspA family protein
MQTEESVYVPDDTFYVGRVKWFNKTGYGFIERMDTSETKDIFVHHSAIQTAVSQFRYLVEGEYVRFKVGKGNGKYTVCSTDVTGPNGGKLMCETRYEKSRERSSTSETAEENGAPRRQRNYNKRDAKPSNPVFIEPNSVMSN